MIKITQSADYDSTTIPVDTFWNVGDETEQKMHRIHAYPAKFPAFITTKALKYAREQGVNVRLVADIFCGCGTVAYEARRNAIPFWGCDVNPVATLIARAKSRSYDTGRLLVYLEDIEKRFKHSPHDANYRVADERIRYWFDARTFRDLSRLHAAIQDVVPPGSKYRVFFLVAFSNILKSCSRWLTKSIKPQVDPNKMPAKAIEAFVKQCHFAILANDESDVARRSSVNIETADFLSSRLFRPRVDLIITSPPYVTSYEYADLHQLSVLWLISGCDYRKLRAGSVGSHHRSVAFDFDRNCLNKHGRAIVNELKSVDKAKARSVAKYFIDIQDAAKQSHRMLKQRGLALFVIGNTKYSGVLIDNARHLSSALYDAGFATVKIAKRKISKKILTPYRDKRGRFTTDGSGRKVYSEEFIVVGQR